MAGGGLSGAQLQAQYEDIHSHMPVLPFCILPKGLAQELDAACCQRPLGAPAPAQCQVCSCSCAGDQLQPLLSTHLDFHARVATATGARRACPVCAAAANSALLLQLATPLPSSHPSAGDRAVQLQQLFLHLAAVNDAPAGITGNEEALSVWVQELACRAYSLSLTASSLRGWRLQPVHSSTQQLLERLLRPAPPAAPLATAAGAVGKQKQKHKQKQRVAPAAEAAAPLPQPSASKRKGFAAAASAAAVLPATPAASKKQRVAPGAAPQPGSGAKKLKQRRQSAEGAAAGTASPAGGRQMPKGAAGRSKPAAAFKTPQAARAKTGSKQQQKKLLLSAPR